MSKLVLLIDDDEDEGHIFKEALQKLHSSHKFMYIQNAENGLKLLNWLLPDYIFIDINMPKIDGFECLSQIKKLKNLKNVPVILYSTGANLSIRTKALELGAADCIAKTYSITSLAEKLYSILSSKQITTTNSIL
ncbi:MAG: response regulator [Parafilimonas sp.]